MGTANASGDIIATFPIEHAVELFLARDDTVPKNDDSLTDAERELLSRSGEITIVWPRSGK